MKDDICASKFLLMLLVHETVLKNNTFKAGNSHEIL